MTLELAQVGAAWPLGASLAVALAARGVHAGRRREVLNEALHELRRPLQALALAAPGARSGETSATQWSLQMAATALERLEHEINGEVPATTWALLPARPLLEAAVGRWRAHAVRTGGTLALHWRAGGAAVAGDRWGLAQALDHLIVNAIEHGGAEVLVEARARNGRLRIAVVDSGTASRPRAPRPVGPVAWISGRRRHGHGLRVVNRTAAAHGGDFRLRTSARGTEAIFELPLAGRAGA